MIDTHCHIDQYKNPIEIADESENKGIITIGVTNLPSHYELGFAHTRGYKKVRLALGMHPLLANEHDKEFERFSRLLDTTSYIGEIGLDYSKEGRSTKEVQIATLRRIFRLISGRKKIVSLHSRKAEEKVFELLNEYQIKLGIFHWYSGPIALIESISNAGYFFSANTAMIESKKGRNIISKIPNENLLVETDGPFIQYKSREVRPTDVKFIYEFLAEDRGLKLEEMIGLVSNNFKHLINRLKEVNPKR